MNEKTETKVVVPELPEGKTDHATLEAAGWHFPADRKGRKGQVGYFKAEGRTWACCRLSSHGYAELIK